MVQGYDVNVTVDGAGAGKASSKAAAAVAAVAAAAKSFSNTILNKVSFSRKLLLSVVLCYCLLYICHYTMPAYTCSSYNPGLTLTGLVDIPSQVQAIWLRTTGSQTGSFGNLTYSHTPCKHTASSFPHPPPPHTTDEMVNQSCGSSFIHYHCSSLLSSSPPPLPKSFVESCIHSLSIIVVRIIFMHFGGLLI